MCCMRTIKYNNKFFGYLACKPSSFTFPLCGSQVRLVHHNQRDKMATSFVVQKGGSQNATPGAEVSISCTKMEGVDKLSLHLE